MANEITLSASLSYLDSVGVKDALAVLNLAVSVGTKKIIHQALSVATSETTITLGGVTSPGYSIFVNRDPTNYVELKVAASGAVFAKMLAGEVCGPIRLGSGAQAPVAIANTAACVMDYILCMT